MEKLALHFTIIAIGNSSFLIRTKIFRKLHISYVKIKEWKDYIKKYRIYFILDDTYVDLYRNNVMF